MLVLFETAAGFALFKLNKNVALQEANFDELFATPTAANQTVALQGFHKFGDTTEGLAATTAIFESKLPKSLDQFLQDNIISRELTDELVVSEAKLGQLIKDKFKIPCVSDSVTFELIRGIRRQISSLISDLNETDMNHMALGLAHSYSRYKLKFSPDKVDTMIVQAISLLDDLDKELNTYTMRVREWYGWHFPEMSKILTQNIPYVRVVLAVGNRKNFATADLSEIVDEEMETELKEVAELSMGSEISDADVTSIKYLAEQVLTITQYREELHEYLKNRMKAIAPNLTTMVGEFVGARLIAHAGSLINLAKHPASTVQILGAEKALFRAMKTKKNTPKYGLIYHASLVSKSLPKNRGKMSRVLAGKVSLVSRVDALAESTDVTVAEQYMQKVVRRFRLMQGHENIKVTDVGVAVGPSVYEVSAPVKGYNDAADAAMPGNEEKKKKKKKKAENGQEAGKRRESEGGAEHGEGEERPRKKNKQQPASEEEADQGASAAAVEPVDGEKKKKKKKKDTPEGEDGAGAKASHRNGEEGEAEVEAEVERPSGKKAKHAAEEDEGDNNHHDAAGEPEKKKKKKKKKSKEGEGEAEPERREDERDQQAAEEAGEPEKKKKKKKKQKQAEREEAGERVARDGEEED